MNEISIDIRFEGENFLPSKLASLTGFPLEILAEFGTLAKRGRYKGKPSPYGMALLKVEKDRGEGDITKALNSYLTTLISYKEYFPQTGLEDIIIDIDTPISKASEFYLDSNSLLIISQLNAKVDLNAYKNDEYEALIKEIILYIDDKILDNTEIKNQLERKISSKEFQDIIKSRFSNLPKKKENLALSYLILFLVKRFEKSGIYTLSDVKKILN